jgi:hypothetical protein
MSWNWAAQVPSSRACVAGTQTTDKLENRSALRSENGFHPSKGPLYNAFMEGPTFLELGGNGRNSGTVSF